VLIVASIDCIARHAALENHRADARARTVDSGEQPFHSLPMWGYAEGNKTVVAIVVVLVAVAALAFLGRKFWRRGR
jgi:hypothetical protein